MMLKINQFIHFFTTKSYNCRTLTLMKQHLLADLMATLSAAERAEAPRWVQSPAHNQREELVLLFEGPVSGPCR